MTLHLCLRRPRSCWDVFWSPPSNIPRALSLHLPGDIPRLNWSTAATYPHLETMTIISKHSMWMIRVKPSYGDHVTVLDVCQAVHAHFNRNMAAEEYGALEKEEQIRVVESYNRNREVLALEGPKRDALLRGDYLQGRTVFGGLQLASNWLIQRRLGTTESPRRTFELLLDIPYGASTV